MTDNKVLTQFVSAKRIPPSLWSFCDNTLQFSFFLTHVPGNENPAADYFLRLQIRPEDRFPLKLTDFFPVNSIEIDIASKTPKQRKDEPHYFPLSEQLRCRRKTDTQQMN